MAERILTSLVVCAALPFVASCVSYSGVSKANDGQIWISGGTTYVFVTVPFIKRCNAEGTTLKCEELSESPPPSSRRGEAGATASEPAAEPTKEAPTKEPPKKK